MGRGSSDGLVFLVPGVARQDPFETGWRGGLHPILTGASVLEDPVMPPVDLWFFEAREGFGLSIHFFQVDPHGFNLEFPCNEGTEKASADQDIKQRSRAYLA